MKKLVCALLVATMGSVMALSGCGQASSESANAGAQETPVSANADQTEVPAGGSSKEDTKNNGDVTTITVWSNDAHSKDVFEQLVKQFNEGEGKELGIAIDLSVYGSDYYSTLDVAIQAGEAPYIFKCNKIPQYAQSGILACLDELPGGKELVAPYEQINSEGVGLVGGKTYAVPYKGTNIGLVYNKELFSSLGLEYPETYEDLLNCARVITENGNGRVYGYGVGMRYTTYGLYYMLPMASASTGSMHFNHGTGRYDFSSMEPYFNLMTELIDEGLMFPGYETIDDDTKRAQFAEGNIGMIPCMSSDVGVFDRQFKPSFEWGVGPFPVDKAGERYKMYTAPSNFYVVNSTAVEDGVEDKVMKVMELFLSEDSLLTLFESEKDMITRDDVREKSTAVNVSEQWKEFGDSSYRYTGYGFPDGLISIEGDSYKDVFDKILTRLVDVKEGLADLDKRYNEALDAAVADGTIKMDDYIVDNFESLIK